MSEAALMWMEVSFNVLYLIAIWALVIVMARRLNAVAAGDRPVAQRVLWAFALLAVGDSGHVGFRVIAYALGGLESQPVVLGVPLSLVGFGALATAITVTLFYVMMLDVWRLRFGKPLGWFGWLLFGAAVVRFALMALPMNEWSRVVPVQPWSTLRNVPLTLQGLGLAYLILRDARPARDRAFTWIGISILISYACYIPVILFIQQVPLLGMLMIPKTVAYVAIAIIAYRSLYPRVDASPRSGERLRTAS